MKHLLQFVNPHKNFSVKRKLKIFDNVRLQQKRWFTILEQKVAHLRNGKSWRTEFLGNNLSNYKPNETETNEKNVIRINKSIIQQDFLENKN